MTIKQQGGIFGRNPTFNNVTVEGDLAVAGSLSVGGETLSGLDFEGTWDANANSPDLTAITPTIGQFWIVSTAGTTNLDGITNWGVGDWALYDGSAWNRIEGGADGNFVNLSVTGTVTVPADSITGDAIDGGTATPTNITADGTINFAGATVSDLGSVTTADINGGSVDGVTLGTNSAVTEAQIDNININGNVISATNTDGNVTLTPNGSGIVDTAASIDFGKNITGENFSVTQVFGTITSGDGTVNIATIAFGNYSGRDAVVDVTARCKSGTGGVRQEYRNSAIYENGGLTIVETNITYQAGSNMNLLFTAAGSVVTVQLNTAVGVAESFSVTIRVMGGGMGDKVTDVYT